MDLRKAYETLGLVRGATSAEVEAAYAQLRQDVETRLARIGAAPVAARYREVRTRLDAARETILAAPTPTPDEPLAHAFEVLGLSAGASPLDVAAAYVALCEEIDREAQDAPTEELRRACLEARADVDAAYQHCALPLLHAELGPVPEGGTAAVHYETQMAAAPFEGPEPAPSSARSGVLRIEPEEGGAKARRRRRGVRRFATAAGLLLVVAGAGAGGIWWTDFDLRAAFDDYVPSALVSRLTPPAPLPELVEARTTSESLRKRVAEERVELQSRVGEARSRTASLENSWSSSSDPAERERMAIELDRARARRELAIQHAELAERFVLTSSELTAAYGKMELAGELMAAGKARGAVSALTEARTRLEASLAKLDVVEEAVGARSEAEAGLDAWRALAASADLGELEAAVKGEEVLVLAREELANGRFETAIPQLHRAVQHFGAALGEGRKLAAAARAEVETAALSFEVAEAGPEPEPGSEPESGSELEPVPEVSARAELDTPNAPDVSARAELDTPDAPDVSAAPSDRNRSAIKLVLVPAGDFFYGCNDDLAGACATGQPPGRRVVLSAFRIDRTEVRVNEYAACVDEGRCTPPATDEACNWDLPERGDHPVNCVDWRQASAYCAWVGKRLPREREWEKAARGTDGRVYPWGDSAASCYRAVIAGGGAPGCGRDSTSPVGSRAEGRSPFGLFDMAGNVLEWTADAGEVGQRIVRGGSWRSDSGPARTFSREKFGADSRDARIGFRCASGGGLYATTAQ